jgi:hypothetical protein
VEEHRMRIAGRRVSVGAALAAPARRVSLASAAPLALVLLFSLSSLGGCAGFSASVDQEFDDYEEADPLGHSPDAMADVLGEPDEWRNEGEGSHIKVIMIWNCLDGKRREAVWRRKDGGDAGRDYWSLLKDETSDGDCD